MPLVSPNALRINTPTHQRPTHQRFNATSHICLLIFVFSLFTGCEWREIQRRNELPQCVQESAGLQIDVYPRLEQVEANLLDTDLFSEASKEEYRMLLGLLYARLVPNQSTALPSLPALDTVCADVEDCDALTRPAVNVAYPQCYRQIAREYELPDRTGFWAQQDDIWNEFFRDGNWRSAYILHSLDATPEDRFNEFEVRAFYTQHALFLLDGRE